MKTTIACIAGALALGLAGAAFAQSSGEDVSKLPGYVNFDAINVFGGQDKDVEIFLDQSVIGMVAAFSKSADPEFANMLGKLKQIRVQTFAIEPEKLEAIEKKTQEMSHKLESQGWATLIKVRDRKENSQTYVYTKMQGGKMQGLVVMSVDPNDEASFINIVGEIDPEQISKLQNKFHLDGLDSLKLQSKDKPSGSDEKDKDKDSDKGPKSK